MSEIIYSTIAIAIYVNCVIMEEVRKEVARRRQIVNEQITNSFEKGKSEVVGTVKSWGGRDYKKTADGKWVPVAKSDEKKSSIAGKHYSDMNKEELHTAANTLGISKHQDLGVKELRAKVADAVIDRNIKQGLAQMKNKK